MEHDMKELDANSFHKLYGIKKPRLAFTKKDFPDYVLMTLISATLIYFSYGPGHWMSALGIGLCAFMIVSFPLRHGFGPGAPVVIKRPQDVLFMLIYKIQNVKPIYLFALGVLLLENLFIYLTPNLPHHVELMRTIGIYLFFTHFLGITAYRTVVLFDHLRKRELVREVLLQTTWKFYLEKQPNIVFQLLHAYFTGVLTHIVMIAPWFVVITYANFSVLALPVTLCLNVWTQIKYFKVHNAWFYRDHWLGHNSEFEFLYLHGTHHDAIPCGLIGVAGNGHLEGFLRHVLSFPTQFFNPVAGLFFFSFVIKSDIDAHQYVPCVFPKRSRHFHEVAQHSVHHFGRLEPYSFGLKTDQPSISEAARKVTEGLPDELRNSIQLDEQLNGFKWDNPAYRKYLELFDKYQKEGG
jgi:hypothetical protein